MKIIIAGAGNVGTHLAKLLSRERQDIILMDDDEEKLSTLSNNFDLMTVTASPSSISGLKEVGVKEADLFIAVTPDESRNMTACMLAHNLGALKTVARIDNYEYLLPKNKEFFQKLGVDSLIYPEMLAAKEIVSSMRMSWVRQWWEFCGGALILIGAKMREKAEILDIPLHQLGNPNIPYHVVAIKRGTDTIIPRGDDTIKLNDIVYFTTTRKYIPYIRKIAGKEDYADVRNVMIMGGSRIAVRTAQYVPDYMQVKIVDNDLNRCNRLTELLDDRTMIINGDGRDMDLLIEEGLKNTEAFVALTGNSETNILACLAAKRMGVNKTVGDLLGPCMFAALMGCSRVFYGKFSGRINLSGFISGSAVLCVCSYMLAVFAPIPLLSLAGCALTGLAVGIMWPGTFSLAAERCPQGGTAMFAFFALAGDLGCSSGPGLVGVMSGAFGGQLKMGLLFAIVFPILMLIGVGAMKKAQE